MEKMVMAESMLAFYKGKTVLVTGHTGFKGSWLCEILKMAQANVIGYSLLAETTPSLFDLAQVEDGITSIISDICDFTALKAVFDHYHPEIVFHLAAQPIVKIGYQNPRETYETNVIGTVNVLECCRLSTSVKSVLNITTDKVYENKEWAWGYRENEPLNGFDPYSNSKSCAELVTHSYKNSFFDLNKKTAVSTARAGNVIGGGDFSPDRILPDCARAAAKKEEIIVRNPHSTRPYQHVLEPLFAYLMIAQKQYHQFSYAGYYNVGPDECDCVTTGSLVDLFCDYWGQGATWKNVSEVDAPHEANFLKLDCTKIKTVFGWHPIWSVSQAVQKTCEWHRCYLEQGDICQCMKAQIQSYMAAYCE